MTRDDITGQQGFGEAVPGWDPYPLPGSEWQERGQILVMSGCDGREAFLAKRDRIGFFVGRMGKALRQYAVFVLAFPSDSFLIEMETEI